MGRLTRSAPGDIPELPVPFRRKKIGVRARANPSVVGLRGRRCTDCFPIRCVATRSTPLLPRAPAARPHPPPRGASSRGRRERPSWKKKWGRTCALPHALSHSPPSRVNRAGRRRTYAASALLAFSASAAKPAASCTAMSASTLRSRVMPALSRPFMKRL